MSINLYYNPATFVVPTGNVRQWTVTYDIEVDGVRTPYTRTFPDDVQAAVTAGYITNDELKAWLFDLVSQAERARLGL